LLSKAPSTLERMSILAAAFRTSTALGVGINVALTRYHEKAEQDILVTQQVYQRAQSDLAGSRPRAYQLKGFQQPIELYTA